MKEKVEVADIREFGGLCVCAGFGVGIVTAWFAQGAGRALYEVLKGVVL